MENQYVSGDLILLSKVEGHLANVVVNADGGTGLLINVEHSKLVNPSSRRGNRKSIKMYKVLINGKILHITKDRIIKTLGRVTNVFLEE